MDKNYLIRREKLEDYREVEKLIRKAFWNVYRPGCSEHYVIHVLRDDPDFVKELDFVMEKDGKIIGQNIFMKNTLVCDNEKNIPILTMGPICITPELQGKGYGKILLDYSLSKATELGFGAVMFEGDINFYSKSDFDYGSRFGIRYHGIPEGQEVPFFLCKELKPGYLKNVTGEYITPKGYFVDEKDVIEFDKKFQQEFLGENERFCNVISLGSNCLEAAALCKYGLREQSGPFDWCTSKDFINGIIPILENDFADFMNYENLKVCSNDDKAFDDLKYKINFNHDIENNFEKEYDKICEKYKRRTDKFREMTKKPTCFVRGCWSVDELKSIADNEERIKNALNLNFGNELVVVVPKDIYEENLIKTEFRVFPLDTKILDGDVVYREQLRNFFDTNDELIDYIVKKYSQEKRKDNLIFDLKSELKKANELTIDDRVAYLKSDIERAHKKNVEITRDLTLLKTIENVDYSDLDFSKKIVIYGCNAIGKIFAKKIIEKGNIIGFIDDDPQIDEYEKIPVSAIEKARVEYDENTIILVVSSMNFADIKVKLRKNYGQKVVIARLITWLSAAKVLDENFE